MVSQAGVVIYEGRNIVIRESITMGRTTTDDGLRVSGQVTNVVRLRGIGEHASSFVRGRMPRLVVTGVGGRITPYVGACQS